MNSKQHTLAKRIFLQAIELQKDEVIPYISTQTEDALVIEQVLDLIKTYQNNTQYTQELVDDIAQNISRSPLLFPSDRYTLIKKIGQGGMGDVFLAQRKIKDIKQKVAIKILQLGDSLSKERFSQEASILSQLSHPNISQFIDADFLSDGRPYVVMEYAEGKSIIEYCQLIHLEIKAIISLFIKLCKAVEHAHRNLIIHRDIKPENIIVNEQGELMLLDFGIAKIIQDSDDHTKTQMHAMTPAYASPEQFMGLPVTVASDVYSLGVLLYELLTNSRPNEPKNHSPIEFEKILRTTNPTKPSEKSAEIFKTNLSLSDQYNIKKWVNTLSGDLDKIVLKALQFDITQRYQTVAEFLDDIERYNNNLPVLAHKPNIGYKVKKFIQRNKLIVVSIIVFLIFIILTFQQKISLRKLSNDLILKKEEIISKEKEVQRDQELAINIAHVLSRKYYTDFDNLGDQSLIANNTVNIATGNLYYHQPINLYMDSIPFSIAYNSDSAMQTKVNQDRRPLQRYSLGKGWNHNYSKKIDYTHICCDSNKEVMKIMIAYRDDGRSVRFKKTDDKWFNISSTKEILTKDGKDWLLIDNESFEYYTWKGQLKKISNKKYTINLKYESGKFLSDVFSRFEDSHSYHNLNDRLTSIVSNNGEQIDFHYINNKTQIIKISNNIGKTWKFDYDLYDNLTKITKPDYFRTIFEYRSYGFYNLMSRSSGYSKGVTSNLVTYSYDPFHRVSSIRSSKTHCIQDIISISYNNDYSRTVKNKNKIVNLYTVDIKNKIWKITSNEINFDYPQCDKSLQNK
jgi:YD repeat-containing protein